MLLIEKIAEERISKAIGQGEFDSLVLQGCPYRMDGYLYESPEQRIVFKILKDHNLLPFPLELKKKIEEESENREKIITNFTQIYIRKLEFIFNLLDITPSYPIDKYLEFLHQHNMLLSKYIPLMMSLKFTSELKIHVALLNKSIEEKMEIYMDKSGKLLGLIEEYNGEIVKATMNRRDLFRNFTTLGKIILKEEKENFENIFPGIAYPS